MHNTQAVMTRFEEWLEAAHAHPAIADATAMCLATADAKARPSARMVLLKSHDAAGFTFYTHFDSRKSRELIANPHAALCFHWAPLGRQLRIEGKVTRVADQESDAYFASRPRESQIGAWASAQSEVLESAEALAAEVEKYERQFAGKPVPRPAEWGGWRLTPEMIEFWQHGEHRLHTRERFTKSGEVWKWELLNP